MHRDRPRRACRSSPRRAGASLTMRWSSRPARWCAKSRRCRSARRACITCAPRRMPMRLPRELQGAAQHLAVVGGGLIGLEVAASAAELGVQGHRHRGAAAHSRAGLRRGRLRRASTRRTAATASTSGSTPRLTHAQAEPDGRIALKTRLGRDLDRRSSSWSAPAPFRMTALPPRPD